MRLFYLFRRPKVTEQERHIIRIVARAGVDRRKPKTRYKVRAWQQEGYQR